MEPDLTDEKITATCDVRDTTFARFGVSGWYWWNGVTWCVLPSPLHTEPMLDAIVARDAEIERLRAALEDAERHADLRQIEVERLQALIDAWAAARVVFSADDVPDEARWDAYAAARDALLAAATREDDRD